MKFLILLVAAAIFANGTSAISIGSLRIDSEIRNYTLNIAIELSTQASRITRNIQVRGEQYYNSYIKLRNELSARLTPLGINGIILGARIVAEADTIVIALLNEFNDFMMQIKVITSLGQIRDKFSAELQKRINELEDAVDANSTAIKCWDDNKAELGALLQKALSQGRNVTEENLQNLDGSIRNFAKKVEDGIARVASEVLTQCGPVGSCIVKYVSKPCLS